MVTGYTMREVRPVRTLAPWIGGKRNLAAKVIAAIEAAGPVKVYAEPFVGMGGVFFRRRQTPACEVINDLSGDVANLFRVLQNHEGALMDLMRWQLTSREEFERLAAIDGERLTDLQRAARFLYVQRTGFGGKVTGRTFGIARDRGGPIDVDRLAGILAAVHARLAGVWIERLPWAELLARWDDPGTLFYLDPPYLGTEHYYGRGMFTRDDFVALEAALKGLRGRFVMTLNDHPEVRRIFAAFPMREAAVTYSVAGPAGAKRAGELIITGPGKWHPD